MYDYSETVKTFVLDPRTSKKRPLPNQDYEMIPINIRLGIKINSNQKYYDDDAEENYKMKRQQLV
jgi:hypothetical protein